VYNSATDSVTLTPKKAFALTKPVQLVVNGVPPWGLQDTYGRLIDGANNGQPGGNAIAILSRGGANISALADDATDVTRRLNPAAVDALLERREAIEWKLAHGARTVRLAYFSAASVVEAEARARAASYSLISLRYWRIMRL
jgi:hypothetical protein